MFAFYSDMSKLSPHEVVANCRTAFDAAEKLGIPRVIEPRDMSLLAVPDKLAVMTYLYQLRSHFTGFQLQIEQLGNTSDESSYVIGNYKTDTLPGHMKLDHLKIQLQNQQQNSYIATLNEDVCSANDGQKSPTEKKDVKNKIFAGSKHLLGKVLSPVKDRTSIGQPPLNNQSGAQPTKDKPLLMTRRELTDPFGSSDDEDEQKIIAHEEQKDTTPVAPNLDPATTNVSVSIEFGFNQRFRNGFLFISKSKYFVWCVFFLFSL